MKRAEKRREISGDSTLSLLKQMLEIYSPSGKEAEIVRFLTDEFTARGLPVRLQAVDDDRFNLLVIPEGKMNLCFVGHIDTVHSPDFDSLVCSEKDGKLYGLGAADMKGGCAAMIEALTVLHHRVGPRNGVGLALVVGEEENGDGAAAFLKEHSFPFAVVGEPTELAPCLAHHGYLEVGIGVKGRRRHASLADSCGNPVESLLRFTLNLVQYLKESRPSLTYNLRDLTSSQSGFAVPDWANVFIDIHVPPEMESLDDLVAAIRAQHESAIPAYADLDAQLRFPTLTAGYRVSDDGPFVDRLRRAYARQGLPFISQSFVSHSDANLLREAGVVPVVLGPGSLLKAHAPSESVRTAEVVTAAELYLNIALSVLD